MKIPVVEASGMVEGERPQGKMKKKRGLCMHTLAKSRNIQIEFCVGKWPLAFVCVCVCNVYTQMPDTDIGWKCRRPNWKTSWNTC